MSAVSLYLQRRLPVGAEPLADVGVHFRVWAPRRGKVEAILEGHAAVVPGLSSLEGAAHA